MSDLFRTHDEPECIRAEMTVYKPGVRYAAGSCIPLDVADAQRRNQILHGVVFTHFIGDPNRNFHIDWGMHANTLDFNDPAVYRVRDSIHRFFARLLCIEFTRTDGEKSVAKGFLELGGILEDEKERLLHFRGELPLPDLNWKELAYEKVSDDGVVEGVLHFRIQIHRIGFNIHRPSDLEY